jgi:hypothetical protein
MFDFLKTNSAVAMLKEDHERVQDLFDQFEAAKSRPAKRKIVRDALAELKIKHGNLLVLEDLSGA